MYQKMIHSNVIDSTAEEIQRAASIIGADAFFIVVGDTALDNKIDQAFSFNSELGLDALDRSIPSTKERCTEGVVYSLQNTIKILTFLGAELLHNNWKFDS
jgi:hypothetical protein